MSSAPTPTPHTAISAGRFVGSIGVNTVLGATNTNYGDFSRVTFDLAYLGVRNVRDAFRGQDDAYRFQQLYSRLGISFDFFIPPGDPGLDWQIGAIKANADVVRFVEGPNEADYTPQSYNGVTGLAAVQAEQTALYTAIHGDATLNGGGRVTPVLQASYGLSSSFTTAGGMPAPSDNGNIHEYFGNGGEPGPNIPDSVSLARMVSPGLPVIASEAGYYTLPSATGVDNLVQAKYTLDILFDNWRAGIGMTYLYQLLDQFPDPTNSDPMEHFGLFDSDGAAKPAAIAVHDLIALLDDPGGDTATGTLSYSLSGLPSGTGHDLLMAKSDGSFVLALWNDVQLWNPSTASEIFTAPVPVVLSLGQTYGSVALYDPLTGVSPIISYNNVSSIALSLPDHPILVKISAAVADQLLMTQQSIPQLVQSGQTTSGLWSLVMSNAREAVASYAAGLTITAVNTSGTTGQVTLNAAAKTLTYTAAAYNPLATMDQFTYVVSDGHGGTASGTIQIQIAPPPNTTYGMTAGGVYTAPSANWTLYSEAGAQTLIGDAAGGDTFVGMGDTTIIASGAGNVISAAPGNHTIVTGSGGAKVNLGNGDNAILVAGTGNTIIGGDGDFIVSGTVGTSSVTLGDGNQTVGLNGAGNTVSVGVGTSIIAAGADGNETVLVAGGNNQITLGGSNDLVHVLFGTNTIFSSTGQSTFQLDAGGNTVIALGNGNKVTGGSGDDTFVLTGANNLVTTGSGADSVYFIQPGNTLKVGSGSVTIYDNGGGNTIVAGPAGGQPIQYYGAFATTTDVFDLRTLLAGTSWNGTASSLSNFLAMGLSGWDAILSVKPSGLPGGAVRTVLDLHGVGLVTLPNFLAHAIV